MRRSELLDRTWSDIDFEDMTIEVSPKKSTDYTWEWLIKDTDRRELPLTKNVLQMLADHQTQQPEGYPYVFVPPARYDYIQQLRIQGKWTLKDARLKVVNNFSRKFEKILKMSGVRKRKFHCLSNTALTNWFANGMSEHDVMTLAGHSSSSTMRDFVLLSLTIWWIEQGLPLHRVYAKSCHTLTCGVTFRKTRKDKHS